jgi:ribose transport system substrate-binding protein
VLWAPGEPQDAVRAAEECVARKLAVALLDMDPEPSETLRKEARFLGAVTPDHRAAGAAAARRLADLLKDRPGGTVVLLRLGPATETTRRREAGFRDGLKASGLSLHDASDDTRASQGEEVAARVLESHKDLAGLFTPDEESTVTCLKALELIKRAGAAKFVGCEANPLLVRAVEAESLHGLILPDPFDMGYRATLLALDHLTNGPPPIERTVVSNLRMATRENLHAPDIKALYSRDLRAETGE